MDNTWNIEQAKSILAKNKNHKLFTWFCIDYGINIEEIK